ncbi:MAG TPA: phenylalanine--tRNA ligase subunit beta, partial [Sedimentisphaerales bacterium]|nr:phenylalanine--tRNA ligase subunit beta [Sedimentisphaerales bacterium]
MKVSLEWLREYVDIPESAEQIVEMLANAGLPCESIEQFGADTVIDVEVTSNRPDCLCHIGIAREIAAVTRRKLSLPEVRLDESDRAADGLASVRIDSPGLCGRYTARVIEGVKVGATPDWMRRRLEAVGQRSVNNIVDATNYAMLETGQPPHAFDYQAIRGRKIIVRKALAGERLTSIDGTVCVLQNDMLIIADAEGPVAIAGVMGGIDTEVNDSTTSVLLEDAYFDPVAGRTTSRKLGLPSEAAYRFECTVDITNIDWASRRTAQLITMVAGGKAARGVVDAYPAAARPHKVAVRLARIRHLLGIEVPCRQAMDILSSLGFEPARNGETIECTIPSWRRSDVTREADLIEEIVRIWGYGKVPTGNKITIEVAPPDSRHLFVSRAGMFLNACGFFETVNVTFVDPVIAQIFGGAAAEALSVREELRKGANILRDNLIGSLVQALRLNMNMKNRPCKIFEIAATFKSRSGQLPEEKLKLGLVCDADMRILRGAVEGLAKMLNRNAGLTFVPTKLPWAGIAAEIAVGGNVIGCAGMLDRLVLDKVGIDASAVCAAELDCSMLMNLESGP